MRVVDLINRKKYGQALSRDEIYFLINGYVNGTIPDYQMSAFLMAVIFQGLNSDERLAFTQAMLESGEVIDLSHIEGKLVDKHSTGGVGDKTTLVVGPIVSACGVIVPKMSGRGLGHTGGTLDKLESIPGFKINLTSEEFIKQVREIGLVVMGQTTNIAPADKKLYALRDVTGTVESVGLIASSIMSKKLASGADHIVLDVKVGKGAFMKTLDDARELAKAMVDIGNRAGKKTVAVLTNMDEPLGEMVGNSLELIEAIETLKGNGPRNFTKLCYELSSEILLITDVAKTKEEAYQKIDEVIKSQQALNKLRQMITYQHGNPQVIDDYSLFPQAQNIIKVRSLKDGYVSEINALKVGEAAMILGAGRQTINDTIDLGVGIQVIAKVGKKVRQGDVLAVIYGNGKNEEEAYQILLDNIIITNEEVSPLDIILDIVR
ncbi:MAG: pyrimidine-nucleoside phosphorylase [Acholeplasmataceae bacterium]|nr:pyrimidine-nucleoside phosphorylase [Acholeplasmataceae bacterium]